MTKVVNQQDSGFARKQNQKKILIFEIFLDLISQISIYLHVVDKHFK